MTYPTPEQIEAAYQAWLNFPRKRGPQNKEDAIRAALVAAAAVTPQELTDKDSEALKSVAQPYAHRFQRRADLGLYVQIRHLPGIVAEWLRGGGR